MTVARTILLLACAVALTACGKVDDADQQYGAAANLLASKDDGMTELTKRLHENLRVENGVVIIDGPIVPGAVVQSKNSPWSVSCGEGLAVNVGKGEIDLLPVALQINEARCALLTKRLGIEIQAIIDGKA